MKDYAEVRDLWVTAGLNLSPGDERKDLAVKLKRDPELFLVAKAGGRIVGSAIGAWDGRRGWVYHLAVHPSYQRRGVATKLLERLELLMRRKGVLKVNAVVYDWNAASLSLFKKNGFKVARDQVFVGKLLTDGA